jgi:hypothetical protein
MSSAERIRRLFVIAAIASLLCSYAVIWVRLIHDPAERTGLDFVAFYAAGRVAQQEGAARVYDPQSLQTIEQDQAGFRLAPGQVLLYNHVPFLIPVLRAIVSDDYVASFYRWVCVLVAIHVLGIAVLARRLLRARLDHRSTALASVGGLVFFPAFVGFLQGQDTAFLFLGVALWAYGLRSEREMLSGVGLSLATVRPHVAGVLALTMPFRHRRGFAAFAAASAMLALFSLAVLGFGGVQSFLRVLALTAGGRWHGMNEAAMVNLIGLLRRAFPEASSDSIHMIGWTVYCISAIALGFLWASPRHSERSLLGPTVVLTLFVVPHLHLHDLALLLIPIYELCAPGPGADTRSTGAVLLPMAISVLFLLSQPFVDLRTTAPYLVLLLLVLYPHRATRRLPYATRR